MDDFGEADVGKARAKAATAFKPCYRSAVCVGNWADDRALEAEKNRIFLEKMARGELLIQKSRRLMNNLLQDVTLTSDSKFVTYGSPIQIKACDVPNSIAGTGDRHSYGLYLSGMISEVQMEDGIVNFAPGCTVSLTNDSRPLSRTTFVLWHLSNCDRPGATVCYNEPFYIRTWATEPSKSLYLCCRQLDVNEPRGPNGHLPIFLTDRPDSFCRFQLMHWNKGMRFDTTGAVAAANTKLVINHVSTNSNLAAEVQAVFPTFFGFECGVSCFTYRTPKREETAENMWMITTNLPKDYIQEFDKFKGL